MMHLHLKRFAGTRLLLIILLGILPFLSQAQKKKSIMAADGFNEAGSDAQAVAIADKVIKNMGGYDAWNNTRYIAWTWRDQYHVWDKFENKFRYERDTLVVISDLTTRTGKVYGKGKEITNPEQTKKILDRQYPTWANNSYWLMMPFKIKDSGVTLKYKGEGKTQAGEDADLIELTFKGVGVTPDNRYILAVDKKSGLITEWSYFAKYTDEKPGFTRPWLNYQTFGKIKISSGRGDAKMDMSNVAAPPSIPTEMFNSPIPIQKF